MQSTEIEVLIEGLLELKSRTPSGQHGDLSILSRTIDLLSSAHAAAVSPASDDVEPAAWGIVSDANTELADIELIAAREYPFTEPGGRPLYMSRLEAVMASLDALAKQAPVTARELFGTIYPRDYLRMVARRDRWQDVTELMYAAFAHGLVSRETMDERKAEVRSPVYPGGTDCVGATVAETQKGSA
jgi:hypothetical protein